MVVDETSPERLAELVSDPRVVAAAMEMRRLVDERRTPVGGWVKGDFVLSHRCGSCGPFKKIGALVHGKRPEHLAGVYGVAEKSVEVSDLANLMKLRPELKNPNVIRSLIAAQAAHEAIAEIPVRAVP